MKDPTSEILDAYIALLNGNLTYGTGTNIRNFKVVKNISKIKSFQHVLLERLDVKDVSVQDKNLYECILHIKVYDGGYKQIADRSAVDSISNQIMVAVGRVDLSMTSFTMYLPPLLQGMPDYQEVFANKDESDDIILSKLLIFKFNVQEN